MEGSFSARVPRSSAELHRDFSDHILEDEVDRQEEGQGDQRDGDEKYGFRVCTVFILISLKTEISKSARGPKSQGPRAEDVLAEPYLVQKILVI